MATETNRVISTGAANDFQVDVVNAHNKLGDRGSVAWQPHVGLEQANLLSSTSFTTTQTVVPALMNLNQAGVEITVNTTVAPGGGQTLDVVIDHKDFVTGNYFAAETIGTVTGTGESVFQTAKPVPQGWQTRLVPSGAGTWTLSGSYSSLAGLLQKIADGDNVALGAKADAAATTDAGTFSLIALFKRLLQKLTTQLPAALVGGRLDVNIGASSATVPVSAASLPLPTGAATEATLATRLSESDFDTKIGSLTETAPATDTASSGLNGRLQRVAQRLTSLIALVPAALVGGRFDVNVGAYTAGAVTEVQGDGAHAATISGNPVRTGARGMSADFTAVTTGQTVDDLATLLGKRINLPFALPANTWSYPAAAGGLVNTTGVTAKAAAGAGIRNYVTKVGLVNSHQTISTEIVIRDGAAGTVLWRGWAQAAGGGQVEVLDPPLRGTANTLIEIAEITTTATAGVLVNLQGYIASE